MERRLRIAKKLLSDRGVIFISIDDNEQANLKLLCDEVFGTNSFVAEAIRRTINSGKHDTKTIATFHEYVLIYSKQIENVNLAKKLKDGDERDRLYKLTDEYQMTRGRYYITQLNKNSIQYSDSLNYPIVAPDGSNIWPGGGFEDKEWVWRWSKERVAWAISNGFIVFKKSKEKYKVYTKSYEFVDKDGNAIERTNPYSTLEFIAKEYGNFNATPELGNIFSGHKVFDFPKSEIFIRELIRISNLHDSTILDFFAGSGTTLHAVMQLNAEDGGHRQCILCTNNENGICENVTYERNKRVIRGYTKPNGEKVEGLHDNNLRYYRTEFVGRSRTPRNMQRLVELSTDMLCIKEDLYAEQTEFGGMRIVPRVFRYFAEGERKMLIIYREEYIEDIVRLIAKVETTAPIRVYVFSPCEDPASELFEPVAEKVEPVALPAAIYNTYKRILPKRRDRRVDTEADNAEGGTDIEPDNELGGLFETQDRS